MGRHSDHAARSSDAAARHRNHGARRRVSRGPIIAVALVVVLALAVFGWLRLRDRIDAQASTAASTCVSGGSTLTVAADASITPALTELAQRYTDTKPVVRDHCITVAVRAAGAQQVLAGIEGSWDNATMGDPPAAWVPQDSSATNQLAAAKPAALVDKIRPVATSPLVLAVPRPAAASITAAGLSWGALPGLQGAPDGWARFGQPGWGTSTIALPDGKDGSTTAALTVQAVAASAANTTALTPTVLGSPTVASALSALQQGAPRQPSSTAATLTAISQLDTVAGSPFQAVPATEQQVFAAAQQPGPTPLAGVPLAGPTPVADYPYAAIKAPWVDDTQSRAAGAFGEFLGQPQQQQTLAAKGFRAGDAPMPQSSAVKFAPAPTSLPAPDAATSIAIAAALGTPAVAPASAASKGFTSTVLLDLSSSMATSEGGSTRLDVTRKALGARIGALPDAAAVGLWTFSTALDGGLPYRVNVPTGALDGARRQNLQTALDALSAKTGSSLNFSVAAAYTSAVQSYAAGGSNSVLVITDSANDGQTTQGELQATIAGVRDPAKPVRIDVVSIGSQTDTAGLRQLTDSTGGTLVQTGVGGGTDLPTALGQLLR